MRPPSHDLSADIRRCAEIIQKAGNGVVLTGAGISTPSGIPDFRSPTGLWKRYNPFEVASLSTFRYRPEKFFAWLREIALEINVANPNPAHTAIVAMEQSGHLNTIITQNVDRLHQQAGSKHVLEIHGSLATSTCSRCYRQFDTSEFMSHFLDTSEIPHCPDCGGILKPDIILFEEQLPIKTWLRAQEACLSCDLILVVGSSLEVLPVAGLPILALENDAPLLIINEMETYLDVRAEVTLKADAADVLPKIAELVNTT
ncbi:MAG: SIR2 family NAD-dependent protein deacylase [Anaerolineales bacterium]